MTPFRRAGVTLRFHFALLALGSALLGSGCSSEPAEPPPPPIVTLSETSNMDPDVVDLIAEHVQRVQATPADHELRGDLGLAYEANGMFMEAEKCYAQAAAMAKDEKLANEWMYKVSLMKRRNGDLPGALDVMHEVINVFTKTPFVQVRLGDMLVESNDMEGAEKAYRRALELEEQSHFARARLAHVLSETGRPEEAIEILERLVADVPTYQHAHFRLGQAYSAVGRTDEAKREMQLGADSGGPGYPPDPFDVRLAKKAAGFGPRMGRVEMLLTAGSFDEAFKELADIGKDRPDDVMVLNLTARAHAIKGDPATGLTWLDKSLEVDQAGYRTHLLYSELAFLAQKPEVALEHANRAVELSPGQGMAHYRRGWVLFYSGQVDEGLEAMCTAEDKGCQDPMLYYTLAQAYGQKEMFEPAMRYAKLAVSKMPRSLGAQLLLARACLSGGDNQAGHTAFLAAEALAPADPGVLELRNIFAESTDQ